MFRCPATQEPKVQVTMLSKTPMITMFSVEEVVLSTLGKVGPYNSVYSFVFARLHSSTHIEFTYPTLNSFLIAGNERFRTLVEKRKRVYLTARFKREKRLIASSIVQEIQSLDPPGRFLSRNAKKGTWCKSKGDIRMFICRQP